MTELYKTILKIYLQHILPHLEWFLDRLSIRAYGGLHPKNNYNFRSEFFLQNVSKEEVVLDIACGTGKILKTIAPKIKKGIGLDYDPKNITLCNGDKPAELEFKQVDIFAADYASLKEETQYTTVILSHILEHIKDPVGFLKLVNAPKLLICVPSQENWRAQLKKSLNLPYMSDKTHFREYTRDMLNEELRTAGYIASPMSFNSEGEITCVGIKQ